MRVLFSLALLASPLAAKPATITFATGFDRPLWVGAPPEDREHIWVVEQAGKMRRARDQRDQSDREAATTIASTLVPTIIAITAKAGSEGKLFGSVTTAEIAQAVADQARVDLDRKTIEVPEAIKTTGEHMVSVKLHADVQFQFKLDVVPA